MRFLIILLMTALPVRADEVRITSADGVEVYADWHADDDSSAPVVILFHQAGGSARGEYPTIVEHLTASGYRVLAVDQRSGGDRFGVPNRTVDAIGNGQAGYCEAYPDLEAAVAWVAHRTDTPLAVWGSSYSAGLLLRLAAEHGDDIDAALAFSPASGGPMKACDPMAHLEDVQVPLAVFRPEREMEIASVANQAEGLRAAGVRVHVVSGGVHGSSMLVPGRSEADLESAWTLVDTFLQETLGSPR